jgi:head-tail adaptor
MDDEFAGGLRETVLIELSVAGSPGTWGPAHPAWAALVPVEDTQLIDIGERRIGRPRFRLTLRTPTAATVTSRFRWRDRLLVVVRVEPDPRTRDRLTFLVEDRT